MSWCNCDASCGENRSHRIGSVGCRFATEEEHDAYWDRQRKEWPTMNYDEPKREQPYVGSMKRPWGEWHVLDVDQGYKVKRLHILPDQAIHFNITIIVQNIGRLCRVKVRLSLMVISSLLRRANHFMCLV